MGQYWLAVNLDKREFVYPHKLGCGLKLWEQVANPQVGSALVVLLASHPEERGGGDLKLDYPEAKQVIGRWTGDRVVIVGDYAEPDDLKHLGVDDASLIWDLCMFGLGDPDIDKELSSLYQYNPDRAAKLEEELKKNGPFRDITHLVKKVLEREVPFIFNPEDKMMCPDKVF